MRTTDIIFISHGGGPLPLLGDPQHQQMCDHLLLLKQALKPPRALLVISAHWETQTPQITAAAQPSLIYDYYGFPEAAYHIQYPAPGAPELAEQVQQALHAQGIQADLNPTRGLDHGVFVPLKILYPEARIPVVQMSLCDSLDPQTHLAMGAALAHLQQEDLLVIGSGFSFHNMQAFFAPPNAQATQANQAFQAWLAETCTSTELTETQRWQRLAHWQQAPGARFCHPREEHLLPLHVCYGMAGCAAMASYPTQILAQDSGMFHWQLSR